MNILFLTCVAGMSTSYAISWFYVEGSFSVFEIFVPLFLIILSFQKPNTQIRIDGVLLILVGIALSTGASIVASLVNTKTDAANPLYLFRSLSFLLIYFLVLHWPTARGSIVTAVFVGMLVSILIAIYVWTTAPRFFAFSQIPMMHVVDSPTGISINRNQIGFCSSLAFVISTYSFLYQDLITRKISLMLCVFLATFTVLTFSKGAWFLMLIGALGLMLLRYNALKFTVWLCALSTAGILTIYLPNTLSVSVMTRFANSGHTNDYRLAYVKDAIDIGSKSPIFGIGPGNYGLASSREGYTATIDPHNAYLQMFAEQGIFAAFLILLFYMLLFVKGLKYRKQDKLSNLIIILLVCLFADGFVSGLSISSKYIYIFSAVLMAVRPKRSQHGTPLKVVGTFGNA